MDRLMERSKYSEYFGKDAVESVAKCKMCSTTISISKRSGTSGMRKHLQRHHPTEFQKLLASDAENNGSRKREAAPPEEDSFAKQMKMIESLVWNCSQLKEEVENSETDERCTVPSENGDALESFLTSTSTAEMLLPGISSGCSSSQSSPDVPNYLQKTNQLNDVESRASNLEDQIIFCQTVAREAEVRAEVLASEIVLKDCLIATLQEELKMKDRVLAEERKSQMDLLNKVKKAHLEKDEATKQRMETLIQKKECLVNDMNFHLLGCTAFKSDLQKENEELRNQTEELKKKLGMNESVDNIASDGMKPAKIEEEN